MYPTLTFSGNTFSWKTINTDKLSTLSPPFLACRCLMSITFPPLMFDFKSSNFSSTGILHNAFHKGYITFIRLLCFLHRFATSSPFPSASHLYILINNPPPPKTFAIKISPIFSFKTQVNANNFSYIISFLEPQTYFKPLIFNLPPPYHSLPTRLFLCTSVQSFT